MENLRTEELIKLDSPALTAIIDCWKDYNKNNIIITIVELKHRNYELNKNLLNKVENFLNHNNIEDFENELSKIITDKGFSNYTEYRKKIISDLNNYKNKFYEIKSPEKISSAGKSLKIMFYCSSILILCFFIGLLVVFNTNSAKTLKNTYIFIGFASVILNIIILVSLYNAGDNLENSVKISDKEVSSEENKINPEQKKPSF